MVPIVLLDCGLLTWFDHHYQGLKENGAIKDPSILSGRKRACRWLSGYLADLAFPIEAFSHTATFVITLFLRQHVRGRLATLVFFSLVPLGLPIVFEGLHVACRYLYVHFCAAPLCLSGRGDGA